MASFRAVTGPFRISFRLTEPLEDTFAGYLSFPGFEIEDEPVRMIGADIC